MISAFQNCSKFEDPTYFGKPCYPKENIINVKYFCLRYGAIKSELGHPSTHLPQQKRQSQNTKKELFWGAFPKNKMYLFIKFSTRPYIQLEMGLKSANFVPIPSQKFF